MKTRFAIIFAMAVAAMMFGGCNRPEEPQARGHLEKGNEAVANEPVKPVTATADGTANAGEGENTIKTAADEAEPRAVCRSFTATAEYELHPPGATVSSQGMLQLRVSGMDQRAIIAARIPLVDLRDARGRPYFSRVENWDGNALLNPMQISTTYGLPQVGANAVGEKWTGLVTMDFPLLERSVLDWPQLTGKIQLLEAANVITADVQLVNTEWQKVCDGIEMRVARAPSEDGGSRAAYAYHVRSADGEGFKSVGGSPCVMGVLAMGDISDVLVYDYGGQSLKNGGHEGVWMVTPKATGVRLFIVKQFKEHTLMFSWPNVGPVEQAVESTADATIKDGGPGDGVPAQKPVDDGADLKMRVAFGRAQFVTKMDAEKKTLTRGVALIGIGGVKAGSPVLSFEPRILRVVDIAGTVYELPDSAEPFRPVTSSGGRFVPGIKCEFKCERMDLPVLPRQPRKVEGITSAMVAGKVESKAFASLSKGERVTLPGGGILELANEPTKMGARSWICVVRYVWRTRPMMPGPGEPAILKICLVDDLGGEIEPAERLEMGNYHNRPDEFETLARILFALPDGRRPVGLRVYYTPSAKQVKVPFVVDVGKPITDDPWQGW